MKVVNCPSARLAQRSHQDRGHASGQRGAATLVIVLLLFFVVSLVAAYTGRNLIFEQRTSTNQYRSTQAMEAAQAGVEWTLAMLNGGRVDASCLPSANVNDNTFRDRYLSAAGNDDEAIADDGAITLRTRADGGGDLLPACVFDGDADTWQCTCPSDGATALPAVASPLAQPMFRIRLIPSPRPDLISIASAGCTRPDAACVAVDPAAPAGDALAVVTAMVSIRGGLHTPPGAPVMARGGLDAGVGPLAVSNVDRASNGITAIAGGGVAGNLQPSSLPGTPPETSVTPPDALLAGLADGRRMFHTVFGMQPETFREQAGAVRVACAGGCDAATIAPLVADNPGRVIWMDGSLTVDGDIGSAQVPALLVATEGVTLSSGTVVGVVYSRAANWDLGVGNTVVRGALIAENNIVGSGGQSVTYDADVLNRLRRGRGSFVPVPGGWKDWNEV
jgi:hypothetical protein